MPRRPTRGRGRFTLRFVDDATGLVVAEASGANTWTQGWGAIAAQAIGRGDPAWRISAMYFEFANVDDPDDAVPLPTVSPAETVAYYLGLAGTPGRDYVRAPLLAPPDVTVKAGYEAGTAGTPGNVATFLCRTGATAGVHGKPFSAEANSKVYGVALAATPAPGDPSRDVVFARGYLASGSQVLRPEGNLSLTEDYTVDFV
jgi:hypothetical protein